MERLIIKTIGPDVGMGLFALAAFRRGEFIAEYTGSKITTAEADASKSRYLFEIDSDWTVDAEGDGGVARYINHSCDPNAEADVHDGHVLVTAVRGIKAGEEITMDYGEEYFDEFIQPLGCRCAAKKHLG